MCEAGYDPEGMVSVFEKFIKLREDEGREEGLVLLSSHPHLEDRIQHVRWFLNRTGVKAGYLLRVKSAQSYGSSMWGSPLF